MSITNIHSLDVNLIVLIFSQKKPDTEFKTTVNYIFFFLRISLNLNYLVLVEKLNQFLYRSLNEPQTKTSAMPDKIHINHGKAEIAACM